jgi:NTP pyrophosphatase (non-canonical NTP hydrolase)
MMSVENLNRVEPRLIHAGAMLQVECHAASYDAGWWHGLGEAHTDYREEARARTRFGIALVNEKIALIHSEVSEALEGWRKNKMDEHLPHRKSIEVELADAVIRIADLAGALGLDLGAAIAAKMAYNAQRADHKPEARAADGGKAC